MEDAEDVAFDEQGDAEEGFDALLAQDRVEDVGVVDVGDGDGAAFGGDASGEAAAERDPHALLDFFFDALGGAGVQGVALEQEDRDGVDLHDVGDPLQQLLEQVLLGQVAPAPHRSPAATTPAPALGPARCSGPRASAFADHMGDRALVPWGACASRPGTSTRSSSGCRGCCRGWTSGSRTSSACRRPSSPTRRSPRCSATSSSERGYEVALHGEPAWNGVAILSRAGLEDVVAGLPGGPGFPQQEARAVAATCGGIRVVSVYVPNGRAPDSDHYALQARMAGGAAGDRGRRRRRDDRVR